MSVRMIAKHSSGMRFMKRQSSQPRLADGRMSRCRTHQCHTDDQFLTKAARMRTATLTRIVLVTALALIVSTVAAVDEPPVARKAFIDGTGPDWRTLGKADFLNVNTDPDTWTWNVNG